MRAVVLAMVAVVVVGVAPAAADEPRCAKASVWNPERGACMARAKAKKGSPAAAYYFALDHLDERMASFDPGKGVELLERACERKLGAACTQLAFVHRNGRAGLASDPAKALILYEQACALGDPEGCIRAARMLTADSKGASLIDGACKAGSGRACHALAGFYDYGHGVDQDVGRADLLHQKALGLLETACDASDGVSCFLAGQILGHGKGAAADPVGASARFEDGCELASGDACYELATRETTFAAAYALDLLACVRSDHADGCARAGQRQLDGSASGAADPGAAVELFERGCWSSLTISTDSCRLVVDLRGEGTRVAKDPAAAARAGTVLCVANGGQDCLGADVLLRVAGADQAARDQLVSAIEAWCARGNQETCLAHAMLYRDGGYVIAQDQPEAARRMQALCEGDLFQACYMLGYAYEFGVGVTADRGQAREHYGRACDGDNDNACNALALLLDADGRHDEAVAIFQRLCDQDDGGGCTSAGWLYFTGTGVDWSIARGIELYERSCDFGDAIGCSNLAEVWEYGIGRGPDPVKAYHYFAVACELEYASACGRAAWYIERGEGGAEQDVELAEAYYTAACNEREPISCTRLAVLIDATGGELAHLQRTAFDSAAEQSVTNPYYTWMLGTFHRDGMGTVVNVEAALRLFVEACERFDALGCLDAGRMYLGDGVAPDPTLAAVHLDKACAAGVAAACALSARPSIPATVAPRARGCCDAGGGSPSTSAALALLVALRCARRRCRTT